MNRFTPEDLLAKGYIKTSQGEWIKILYESLPTEAPIPPAMPKPTPKPSKRLKTAKKVKGVAPCLDIGLFPPEPEYRFDVERRWRFDYAYPAEKVAVEVEGGVWIQGRHTRGSGFVKDMEKYNRAAELGWRILRVQPQDLLKPEFIAQLTRTLTP